MCYLIDIGIGMPRNNVVCNRNGFVNDVNNENFCGSGYYEYPNTNSCAPTPAAAIEFNETGNKLPGIDILEYVFGVYLCENNIINEINNNEMNNMVCYIFEKNFSSFFIRGCR